MEIISLLTKYSVNLQSTLSVIKRIIIVLFILIHIIIILTITIIVNKSFDEIWRQAGQESKDKGVEE